MMRKLTLLFLLCTGFQNFAGAQVRDSVAIALPPYTDTTCPGTQLVFTAMQSNDTFSGVSYYWYANSAFTGVIIDTFKTTALSSGDSVYCVMHFTNSFGIADSDTSNVIYVYHDTAVVPGVVISILVGSNPDCAGHPLTFVAYPIDGGPSPVYQWMVNGAPVAGADSNLFTGTFGGSDTVSCQMVSNSPCSTSLNDTVVSNNVAIIHLHLTAGISIINTQNPICGGGADTFTATLVNPGSGYTVKWYVSGTYIPGAVGNVYRTDTLHNGDIVYAILRTTDSCIVNDSTNSNDITMTVEPNKNGEAFLNLIRGSNPGCLDSTVTFKGTYDSFGTAPNYEWYINGIPVKADSVLDTTFLNGDIVTFHVNETDNGCYLNDSVASTAFLMLRDSTPPTPLVSLIGDLLVTNKGGAYTWYDSSSYPSPIAGATGQTFHPSKLGFYWCTKDSSNCPSLPSNVIYISLLKVNNVSAGNVKIYPNPTTGMLYMDWDNRTVNMQVAVYNIIGQEMIRQVISNQSHSEIDMSHLPAGNYMVVLRDNNDGSTATYKVYLSKG